MDSTNVLDLLKNQIGRLGLIIEAKALEMKNKSKLNVSEIERLILVLSSSEQLFTGEIEKKKFISILNFYLSEYDNEKISGCSSFFDQLLNSNKILLRNSISNENLHVLFNLIEYHDKFKTYDQEKLTMMKNYLSVFEKLNKNFEEFVLYKYYKGVLYFYLGDYNVSKNCFFDIVCDISDQLPMRTAFVEYIELKTSILNIKILEAERNTTEELMNMEALYETHYQNEDIIALKLSFKISDLLLTNFNYDKALIYLTQIFKKLKKMILLGIYNRFPETIEISLNLICRVVYCYTIIGQNEESLKFVKKLEKLNNMLKELNFNNNPQNEMKDALLKKYSFYLLIFKNICKYGTLNRNEHNTAINNYRDKFKTQINYDHEIITNICSFNSSDTLACNFSKIINENISIITNNKFQPVKYLNLFFSLFNQISNLTKNVTTDTNLKKQLEYVEKIRNSSKAIVNYINKYLDTIDDFKYIFSFHYFKEVLIKIHFSYIFSYFFTKEYKTALELLNELEVLKCKLGLDEGAIIKTYACIIKLKGDITFKIEDYSEACINYSKVIKIYEDTLNNSESMALVLFNIGLCYLYSKEYALAKNNISLSKCKYELLNSTNKNQYDGKINNINKLIQNLSQIFSEDI